MAAAQPAKADEKATANASWVERLSAAKPVAEWQVRYHLCLCRDLLAV